MSQRQMDLQTAMRVLRHRWWLLVLAVAIGAVPTYLVSRSLPEVYEADTTLLVGLGLPGTSPDYQQPWPASSSASCIPAWPLPARSSRR